MSPPNPSLLHLHKVTFGLWEPAKRAKSLHLTQDLKSEDGKKNGEGEDRTPSQGDDRDIGVNMQHQKVQGGRAGDMAKGEVREGSGSSIKVIIDLCALHARPLNYPRSYAQLTKNSGKSRI